MWDICFGTGLNPEVNVWNITEMIWLCTLCAVEARVVMIHWHVPFLREDTWKRKVDLLWSKLHVQTYERVVQLEI